MAATRKKSTNSASGEGLLYLLVFMALLSGWFMIMTAKWANAPVVRLVDVMPLLLLGMVCWLAWFVFRGAWFKGDRLLLPLILLIAGVGFLVQFRLGRLILNDFTRPSTLAYAIGLAAFIGSWLLFRQGRYNRLDGLALPALLLAVGVLGFILLTGQRFRGAVFAAGHMNPAEFIKLLLAVYMAGVITDYRKPLQQTVAGIPAPPASSLITLAVLWALPMGLLVVQRDLGMIMLLNTVLLVLLFMVTGRWGYLWLGGAAAGLAGVVGFRLFSHARVRLIAWQDPFVDPTGKSWQILQALSAMFTGGMWGSGLGSGSPSVVPIAESDFVYAAIAEELGFAGCILLVLVYLLLFYRGYRIADQNRQPFAQALAAAITTMLALQTLMNLAGVTKAIPLTGITLPLISYGGSSLVTTFIMLGLLLAMSESAGAGGRGKGR